MFQFSIKIKVGVPGVLTFFFFVFHGLRSPVGFPGEGPMDLKGLSLEGFEGTVRQFWRCVKISSPGE